MCLIFHPAELSTHPFLHSHRLSAILRQLLRTKRSIAASLWFVFEDIKHINNLRKQVLLVTQVKQGLRKLFSPVFHLSFRHLAGKMFFG